MHLNRAADQIVLERDFGSETGLITILLHHVHGQDWTASKGGDKHL